MHVMMSLGQWEISFAWSLSPRHPRAMQGQPPGGAGPFQPSPFASPFLPQPDDPPLLLSTSGQPGGPPPPPFQEQQPIPSTQQAAQAKHGPRHPSIVLVHLGVKV